MEVNGYPWGKIDIAISQVLAFLEPCFYAQCIVRMALKRLTGKTFVQALRWQWPLDDNATVVAIQGSVWPLDSKENVRLYFHAFGKINGFNDEFSFHLNIL